MTASDPAMVTVLVEAHLVAHVQEFLSLARKMLPSPATMGDDSGNAANVFRRHGEFWQLWYAGATDVVPHIVGMDYVARLLASPGSSSIVSNWISPYETRAFTSLPSIARHSQPTPHRSRNSTRLKRAEGSRLSWHASATGLRKRFEARRDCMAGRVRWCTRESVHAFASRRRSIERIGLSRSVTSLLVRISDRRFSAAGR